MNNAYKKIEFVNFNCTFGEECSPLLSHFSDILYTALTQGYVFKKNSKTQCRLQNVRIENMNDAYVLVGNFVKDTIIEVKSHSYNDDIIPADEKYPSSPYSIFILSLKNHRMAFYRNQPGSPYIRSMKTIVSDCVKRYLRKINKGRNYADKLPAANINITPIPSAATVEEKFGAIKKINHLSFKVYPLNGDPDISEAFSILRQSNQRLGSKSLSVQIPSPNNIYEVERTIKSLDGRAIPKVKAIAIDGSPVEFDENSFTESLFASINPNDNYNNITKDIYSAIKGNQIMTKTSDNNLDIYKRSLDEIKLIVNSYKS